MMKKKSTYLYLLLAIAIIVGSYAWTAYNAGPRDLSAEKADIQISANALLADFQNDEAKANTMYLDKVITVEGVVASIESSGTKNIVLETDDLLSTIVCEMTDAFEPNDIVVGSRIAVKGHCTGFLSDVILVKCVIEN